ncbi:hypothetical protein N665_3652s0004 [Sinapis alba]|nr:hypothetical protein N665_3652s0004 [Sinapis alba]
MKSSWVKVVHNGPALLENVLDVEMAEGKEVVSVHDSVIQDSVPLWDDLLEGKFMAKAPHVVKIHIIVNKIWPIDDASIKINVFEVNEVTVKFWIKDSATRKRLLKRGMWNIANVPRILSKWSPIEEENEEEEIKITMKNVPHKMFSLDISPMLWENRKGYILIRFYARVLRKQKYLWRKMHNFLKIRPSQQGCRAKMKILARKEASGKKLQTAEQVEKHCRLQKWVNRHEPSTREEQIGSSWSDVSPAKVGRSGSRNNIVTQKVGSPSRFVVLPEESVSNEELSEETDTEKVKENKKEEGEIMEELVQISQEIEPETKIDWNENVDEIDAQIGVGDRTRRSALP